MADFFPGWRRELEDQTFLHALGPFRLRSPIVDAPESFDPREFLTVNNQGSQGSCSGNALTTVVEVVNYLQTQGGRFEGCRQFAYVEGQRFNNLAGQDQGATISGVVQAATSIGVCEESLSPYTGQYYTKFPKECYEQAAKHKIKNHVSLRSHQQNLDFLRAQQGATVIGIMWTEGLANNKTGRITRANSRGRVLGGHAIGLVGWEKNGELWLANSHSEQWGNGGYALCDPDWIDEQSRDEQSEFIGVSALTETFGEPQSWDWLKNPMPYG